MVDYRNRLLSDGGKIPITAIILPSPTPLVHLTHVPAAKRSESEAQVRSLHEAFKIFSENPTDSAQCLVSGTSSGSRDTLYDVYVTSFESVRIV